MLPGKSRALLYRQLGDMARSSIAIERAFTIAASSRRGKVRAALDLIAHKLRGGSSLADAFQAADGKHPGLFATWEMRYIGFGEKAGHLPDFLLGIADQAEEAYVLTMELVSGLAYPLFLLYLALLAGPLAKLILQGPAAYLAAVAGPVTLATALLAGAAYALVRPGTRRVLLAGLRPFPLLGKVLGMAGLYRTITALALAYRGGLPLDEAWTMATEAADDRILIGIGQQARAQIMLGHEVAPLLERFPHVFPLPVRTAYQTGEATGSLDSELLHAAKFLRRELEMARKGLVKATNTLFFLAVAGVMCSNILEMYRGPMAMIDDLYKELP